MSLFFILIVLGGFCIFYSLYLHLENLKLKRQVRAYSWLNYHRVTSTLANLDNVITLYKAHHRTNLNPEVLEPIIRIDAHNKEFSNGIIHQVQMFEPSFTERDFSKWLSEGKIDEESIKTFKAIKITNPEKKTLCNKLSSLLRRRSQKKKSKSVQKSSPAQNSSV